MSIAGIGRLHDRRLAPAESEDDKGIAVSAEYYRLLGTPMGPCNERRQMIRARRAWRTLDDSAAWWAAPWWAAAWLLTRGRMGEPLWTWEFHGSPQRLNSMGVEMPTSVPDVPSPTPPPGPWRFG